MVCHVTRATSICKVATCSRHNSIITSLSQGACVYRCPIAQSIAEQGCCRRSSDRHGLKLSCWMACKWSSGCVARGDPSGRPCPFVLQTRRYGCLHGEKGLGREADGAKLGWAKPPWHLGFRHGQCLLTWSEMGFSEGGCIMGAASSVSLHQHCIAGGRTREVHQRGKRNRGDGFLAYLPVHDHQQLATSVAHPPKHSCHQLAKKKENPPSFYCWN